MNKNRRRVLAVITAGLLILTIMSAGCISTLNPLPHEVMVRENIIAVNPEYVPSSLIISLLVNPNGYETSLFDALDEYLPRENPVIEIGAGIGAVSAYVNDRLFIKTEHIALEPNPYYTELLRETKKKNNLGTRFVQGAINYDAAFVPYVVSRNIVDTASAAAYTDETVTVQSLTLSQIIRDSTFVDKTNITLIVDAEGVCEDILDNEPALSHAVSTIITTVTGSDEIFELRRKAESAGYTLANTPLADESGLMTLVFQRT